MEVDAQRTVEKPQNTLAESRSFVIRNDYETALLYFKNEKRENVIIGDFYGDPVCAVIDKDERFCAVGGCGVIVYYLRDPFLPYRYNSTNSQWVEFYRDGSIEITFIRQTGPHSIELSFEKGGKETLIV